MEKDEFIAFLEEKEPTETLEFCALIRSCNVNAGWTYDPDITVEIVKILENCKKWNKNNKLENPYAQLDEKTKKLVIKKLNIEIFGSQNFIFLNSELYNYCCLENSKYKHLKKEAEKYGIISQMSMIDQIRIELKELTDLLVKFLRSDCYYHTTSNIW